MKILLKNEQDTEKMANLLAGFVSIGSKIYLHGQLGAGKTTFTRYLLRSLGVKEVIKSPSYTLIERYETNNFPVFHVDCYRLADAEEFYYLGLADEWDASLLIVEWPEKAAGFLPQPDLNLKLILKGSERFCELEALGAKGEKMIKSLSSF